MTVLSRINNGMEIWIVINSQGVIIASALSERMARTIALKGTK